MAGLVRIVADDFGATLGSALIYTVGGAMLLIVRKPTPIAGIRADTCWSAD